MSCDCCQGNCMCTCSMCGCNDVINICEPFNCYVGDPCINIIGPDICPIRGERDDTPKSTSMRLHNLAKPVYNRENLGKSPKPVTLGGRPSNRRKSSGKGKSGKAKSKGRKGPGDKMKAKKSPGKKPKSKTRGRSKDNKKVGKGAKKSQSKSKKGKKSKSKSKSKSAKSGKSKGKSKSKSSSKSRSTSPKRGRKSQKSSKGSKRGESKKKSRGRSKKKSGRKPRGPPPTPVILDQRKVHMQRLERLEKFNQYRLTHPETNTRVNNLRGYSSDPESPIPCHKKFNFKVRQSPVIKKCPSMGNLCETKKCFTNLFIECPYDEDDFKVVDISPITWKKWFELFEKEKNRFSFYDELYAKKYVTDSMEVPRYFDDITYLIDADDEHYRKKIDYGRIVLKTKHIYTGNFIDWYFHGPGRYVWLDGGVYQGDFVNGVMHGQGTFLWPDGAIYEGQYMDGYRKGWGIYTTADGYIYSGDWQEGVPTGKGKVWYDPRNNADNFYEGDLHKGVPDGFGVRRYGNGDKYVGTWKSGVRSGLGTILWKEQKQMYRGQWSKGLPHGQGIQVWYLTVSEEIKPGKVEETKPEDKTVPSNTPIPVENPSPPKTPISNHNNNSARSNPESHSENAPTSNNLDDMTPEGPPSYKGKQVRYVFKGKWENGMRHGKGTLFYPDQSIYEGYWEKGRQLHDGVFTDPVGEFMLKLECIPPDEVGFMLELFDRATLECIFKHMIDKLNQRFPIKAPDDQIVKEEVQLTNICLKYFTELRLMYQRAGDLANLWSNNTLSAKSTRAKDYRKFCFKDKDSQKSKYGNLESIFTELDDVLTREETSISRFGLWLLVKDLDSATADVTLAHYDKYWQSIPSICFQQNHNPFDVVHFWQYLQCLVVVAFELSTGIPFDKTNAKYKCERASKTQVSVEEKVINEITRSPGGMIYDKASKTTVKLNLSDDDFIDIPPADDGTIGRPPSTLFEIDAQTETEDEEDLQESSDESDIVAKSAIDCNPISISQVFEQFIEKVLVKGFDQQAGKFLPPLANPLPPVGDLFQIFKLIKCKNIITANEFLFHCLPHLTHPDNMDPVYWLRSKQILSPIVNYDLIFEEMRAMEIQTLEIDTSGTVKGTRVSKDSVCPIPEEVEEDKSKEEQEPPSYLPVPPVFAAESDDTNLGEETTLDASTEEEEESLPYCGAEPERPIILEATESLANQSRLVVRTPRVIEETVQDVLRELLIPDEEFVLLDASLEKDSPPEPLREWKNLDADDVICALGKLYPGLCGCSVDMTLKFDMIFCDWLWAIIHCSNISNAKDKLEGYEDNKSVAFTDKVAKISKFRTPTTFQSLRKTNTETILCCTTSRRSNNRRFFLKEILPVFLRHQDIRQGEPWAYDSQTIPLEAPAVRSKHSAQTATMSASTKLQQTSMSPVKQANPSK